VGNINQLRLMASHSKPKIALLVPEYVHPNRDRY